MNAPLVITLFSLAVPSLITAQTTVQPAPSGTILDLVEEFQNDRPGKPNEVTVVLPPPDETPFAVEKPHAEKGEPQPLEDITKPEAATAEANAPADNDTPVEPKPGLSVRVERLQTGSAEIDPAKVKLLAPFPAKLLARSPKGWHIESAESAPPFNREVEFSPGKRITLNVRPHLLVAEVDGSNVFQIAEPGYDAALGYRQNATVAAILSNSVRQLEDDSRQLGTVIDQLQQLLVSLPQQPNVPEPALESKPKPNRKR